MVWNWIKPPTWLIPKQNKQIKWAYTIHKMISWFSLIEGNYSSSQKVLLNLKNPWNSVNLLVKIIWLPYYTALGRPTHPPTYISGQIVVDEKILIEIIIKENSDGDNGNSNKTSYRSNTEDWAMRNLNFSRSKLIYFSLTAYLSPTL